MKNYVTNDGEKITAATSRDVIKALRTLSRDPEANLEDFMSAMASRVTAQTGATLNLTSEAEFVTGLVQAGLLKEEGTE